MELLVNSIKVKKLHEAATFDRAHVNDAGFDLTCCGVSIADETPGNIPAFMLHLGVAISPPGNLFIMLAPRSSFCLKYPFTVCGSNIIDNGYRGELFLAVKPYMGGPFEQMVYEKYMKGEDRKERTVDAMAAYALDSLFGKKIAQAIPIRGETFDWTYYKKDSNNFPQWHPICKSVLEAEFVDELDLTKRGERAFGSSGE